MGLAIREAGKPISDPHTQARPASIAAQAETHIALDRTEDRQMTRPRACGVLIRNDAILMVLHVEPTRSYWTLPGGALEIGETPAEAVVREFSEETGLCTHVSRLLFTRSYCQTLDGRKIRSPEYIFLVNYVAAASSQMPAVTCVPEGVLRGVAWKSLDEMRNHRQVSAALRALDCD